MMANASFSADASLGREVRSVRERYYGCLQNAFGKASTRALPGAPAGWTPFATRTPLTVTDDAGAWCRATCSKPWLTGAGLGGSSKQKIALRHRQCVRRRAGQKFAVGAHLVGLRVDREMRRRVVVHHTFLGDFSARVVHRDQLLLDLELFPQSGLHRRLRDEHHRRGRARAAE